jgi:hypothetical protein
MVNLFLKYPQKHFLQQVLIGNSKKYFAIFVIFAKLILNISKTRKMSYFFFF